MAHVDDVEGEDQRSAEGKKIAVIHALKIQSAGRRGGDSQQVQADECHHYAQRAPAADRAFPEQGEEYRHEHNRHASQKRGLGGHGVLEPAGLKFVADTQ